MPSAELGRKWEGHFRVVIFGSRLEQGLNADFGSCCAAALWDVMPAKRRTAAKRRQGVAQPTHVGSRVRGSGNETLPLRPAQLLRDYREMPDWPFADTLAEDRLAPEYLVRVYRRGRLAIDHADAWLRENGLQQDSEACELRHLLGVIDQMLMYDGMDVVNSAACEMIARRCLAIEATYGAGGDGSSGLQGFETYDISSMSSEVRIPAVDRAVLKRLALKASFDKLLRQTAQTQDPASSL